VLYDLKKQKAAFPLEQLQKKLAGENRLDEELLKLFDIWNDLDFPTFRVCASLMQEFDLMYLVPRKDSSEPVEYLVPLFHREGFRPPSQKAGLRASLGKTFREGLKLLERRSALRSERTREYVFPAYVPHGLFFRLVARWHRLAQYKSVSEHGLDAMVEYIETREKPNFVRIQERLEEDGCGSIKLQFWVESRAPQDVENLDRTMKQFLVEVDDVLRNVFPQLPCRVKETQEESGKAVLKDLMLSREGLKDRQMRKRAYPFKVELNEALEHQLKMANKTSREILEVALKQLRALHLKTGKSLSGPFPLHPNDKALNEALETLLKNSEEEFSSRESVEELCRTVRRLSSRLRTDFDAFLSHSWGRSEAIIKGTPAF